MGGGSLVQVPSAESGGRHIQGHMRPCLWFRLNHSLMSDIALHDLFRSEARLFKMFFNLRTFPSVICLVLCWNVQNGPQPITQEDGKALLNDFRSGLSYSVKFQMHDSVNAFFKLAFTRGRVQPQPVFQLF